MCATGCRPRDFSRRRPGASRRRPSLFRPHVALLEKLGLVLHRFNTACNLLYRQSAAGKAHPWVAPLLDAGKPPELVALSRHDKVKGHVPAVIRPDLILTDDRLRPERARLGARRHRPHGVAGGDLHRAGRCRCSAGPTACARGFAGILPDGDVLISEESATYRPEMEWLLGAERVKSVEDFSPTGRPAYRFFEAFDFPKLEKFRTGLAARPVP